MPLVMSDYDVHEVAQVRGGMRGPIPDGLNTKAKAIRIAYQDYGYPGSPFMLDADAAGRFVVRRWSDSEILMEIFE